MRKLLLLMTALLTLGASGAWAQLTSISDGTLVSLSFQRVNNNVSGWIDNNYRNYGATEATAVVLKFEETGVADTYYIKNVTTGKYIYATSTEISTGSSDVRLAESQSLPSSSGSANQDENLDAYKWVVHFNSTVPNKTYGTNVWDIAPFQNTNLRLALWSQTAGSTNYIIFYNSDYDIAYFRFYKPTVAALIAANLTLAEIKSQGYTADDIAAHYTPANLDVIGWPSTAAFNSLKSAIEALGDNDVVSSSISSHISNMWTNVVYPSTGFYYFHNVGSNRYAFSDEELDASRDYLNDAETRTAKYIWHVTLTGDNKVQLRSLTGKGMVSDKGEHVNNMSLATAFSNGVTSAYGAFYVGEGTYKYLQDPMQPGFTLKGGSNAYESSTNPMKVAGYAYDSDNAKAYWKFESVDMSAFDVYSVSIVDAPSNKYVQYTGDATTGNKKVYDGGWYLMTKEATVSESDFTPEPIDNYETSVRIADNTITVTYTILTYIDQVNANIKPFIDNPGTGYFQITSEYAAALQGAINTANEDGIISESEYNELLSTLNTLIKMPQTGYYRIKSAGARQVGDSYIAYGKSNGSSYTGLITKGVAEGIGDYSTIMKLTKLGNGKYNITTQGLNVQGVTESRIVQASSAEGVQFTFDPAPASGSYCTISATGNNREYFHESAWTEESYDYNIVLGWGASAAASKWGVEDVNSFTISLNGPYDGKYYATLCLPFTVTLSGVEAYTLTLNGSKTGLTLSDVITEVPAGTPVLLRGTSATATASIASDATYVSAPLTTTSLTGTFVNKSVTANTDYFLGVDENNKAGFYKWEGTTLKANRAYLPATALASGIKGFTIDFDDETAIMDVHERKTSQGSVYNLAGQRVNKPKQGLYIVNGKKVVIK